MSKHLLQIINAEYIAGGGLIWSYATLVDSTERLVAVKFEGQDTVVWYTVADFDEHFRLKEDKAKLDTVCPLCFTINRHKGDCVNFGHS